MPLCNRMFCCIFGWYFYIEIRLKYEKNILLSSSRAFSLSTHTFSLSTSVDNSEATWKKATKCNKFHMRKVRDCVAYEGHRGGKFRKKKWRSVTFLCLSNSCVKQCKHDIHKHLIEFVRLEFVYYIHSLLGKNIRFLALIFFQGQEFILSTGSSIDSLSPH